MARFFPPPSLIAMPSVGVDISDQTIKFLRIARIDGPRAFVRYGEVRLESGVVVGGEIRNREKLISGLRRVAEREELRFVRASLPEQKAYFFTTNVPATADHEQVLNMLEFQLEEHVPLSPPAAVIDYDRVPPSLESHREHIDVGVTVYPRETVEKYVDAFSQAGFVPLSFEIEAQAIRRAVLPRDDADTSMIVDFGETGTGLAIVSRGMLAFTSTLDVVGADLTSIIIEELGASRKSVVEIKNTVGMVPDDGRERLAQRLSKTAAALGSEIKRHAAYWESHGGQEDRGQESIARVVLCGGNANVRGLPEYLSRVLELPVERANVWQNAFSFDESIPDMPYEVSLSYATAVGLALREIN